MLKGLWIYLVAFSLSTYVRNRSSKCWIYITMECNKEEANRAKGIAELKMQNDDFEGARKVALKAQQLFPELENICQLLAVCDVHCSARNKIFGSEKDWYSILQVQRFTDEATIKKQYRRLALVLHPDKNKFPGAEAAFKLIGEANMVLSDQAKRSLYDNKCRVSTRTVLTKPPPHQVNRNPYVAKQYGGQNNIPNAPNSQFSGLNHNQQTKPGLSNDRPSFWTSCPFCHMKYQYYREIVNRSLRCQNCSRPFIAYDIGAQGVPSGANWGQPKVPQQAPNQGAFKVGSKNTAEVPSPHMRSQGIFSNVTIGSERVSRTGNTAGFGEGLRTKGKEDGKFSAGAREEGVGTPSSATCRNTSKKRGRKTVVESSESSEASSSADSEEDIVVEESSGNPSGQTSGPNSFYPTRRSSRQRQQVSYDESLHDDDDFVSPPKRSRSHNSKEEHREPVGNELPKMDNSSGFAAAVTGDKETKGKAGDPPAGGLPNRIDENGKHRDDVEAKDKVDGNVEESIVIEDSDNNSDSSFAPEPEFYDCPDPEFNDFEKDKEEGCFEVDQMWACFDNIDGMPRFYARIRKVCSPGFKLKITWLEPQLDDQLEINWFEAGLPVACGKFILGNSEETSDHLMFSHRIEFDKGFRRSSYIIYPKKGEIWALFKDWDIRWSSDHEKAKKYKFEIVEVVSDYDEATGISVVQLDKLEGFVSLFQQKTGKGFAPFMIPTNQLLRFSHRIPSFTMSGSEREGVPAGSFELDPASLPSYLNDHPEDSKMGAGTVEPKVNG